MVLEKVRDEQQNINPHLNHFIVINASCSHYVGAAGARHLHHLQLVISIIRVVRHAWTGCLGTLVVWLSFPVFLAHTVEAVAILPCLIYLHTYKKIKGMEHTKHTIKKIE